jgi:predicted dehydrogenase
MGITAAVIGCGNISRFHFSGLEKAGPKVKWVCDLDEEAMGPWAKQFEAQVTADFREALADPEVDVVHVTLISSLHKRICLEAIAAGKAVVCEKTLTESAADSLEIVQAAATKGTVFYTSYMKRYIPAVAKAKELLPSLGRILSTRIQAFQQWGNLWEETPSEGFFASGGSGKSEVVRRYGGGILVCGGSHILDLVLFLLGRPQRLYATQCQAPGLDYDLQAAALMETANGVVHFEALAHPLGHIGFLADGWDERVEITGTGGRLEILSAAWDQVETKASRLVHYDNATGQSTDFHFQPVSPFDLAVAQFCAGVAAGEQLGQSRITGYEVDELIDHIHRSAAQGQALEIAWRL